MTNENPCYKPGALWKTRTKIKAKVLAEITVPSKNTTVPRGEPIMLLAYEMNQSYEEHIAFLWKEQIYFALNVDTGFSFELDPGGVNTSNVNGP